jgi:xylan 1,4-beta-xylosidase
MYSSYTAASFARKLDLARRHGVKLDAALTWAFTFENQPLFAGFRQLATGGIDLPVLNVFRMFSRISGQQLAVTSDSAVSLDDITKTGVRGQPDVSAQASLDHNKLAVLLWHYHDDDVIGPNAMVRLTLNNLPNTSGKPTLTRYAIDADHSNAFSAWQKMGSPAQLTSEQYEKLEKAGQLTEVGSVEAVSVRDGTVMLNLALARQAVVLLVLSWE